MNRSNVGAIQVIIAALLWSTSGVFIKSISLDPIFIAAIRSGIAGIILLPFIKFKKLKFSFNLLALLVSYAYTICSIVVATKLTVSANAIALQYTAPLWIFIYTIIISKKIPIRRIIPMVCIAMGILMFLLEPVEGTNMLGNMIAVSSGVAFAATTYFMHKPQCISGEGLISLCNIVAVFCIAPFIPETANFSSISISNWIFLVYLGVFQIGMAYVLYSKGLQSIEPLRATIISLIEPILNPIWVFLFVHEIPTIYALLGGMCILAGIILDMRVKYNDKNSINKVNIVEKVNIKEFQNTNSL